MSSGIWKQTRLHSIFWGMMTDSQVLSAMWCHATQYHVAYDVRLCSIILAEDIFLHKYSYTCQVLLFVEIQFIKWFAKYLPEYKTIPIQKLESKTENISIEVL
jgi:hypothetical protein